MKVERALLGQLQSRVVGDSRRALDRAVARVAALEARAVVHEPDRMLARGWSITTSDDGRVVASVDGLVPGTSLSTRVADGTISSTVTGTSDD